MPAISCHTALEPGSSTVESGISLDDFISMVINRWQIFTMLLDGQMPSRAT
ncbi:MAG TPA: hypothetical protein VF981_09600 [Gemmatimonadaceae bacterium]